MPRALMLWMTDTSSLTIMGTRPREGSSRQCGLGPCRTTPDESPNQHTSAGSSGSGTPLTWEQLHCSRDAVGDTGACACGPSAGARGGVAARAHETSRLTPGIFISSKTTPNETTAVTSHKRTMRSTSQGSHVLKAPIKK